MWLRIFIMSLALLALTGCKGFIQNNIDAANENPGVGLSEFDSALERGYLDLAQGEVSEDDFTDSGYFLHRAIAVKRGQTVEPTEISEREFTPENLVRAENYRAALIDFLARARRERPKLAGETQVMFDCWLQELEENRQPTHISACEEALLSALGGIPGADAVYFAFDRADQIVEGGEALRNAIANAISKGVVSVVITANADSSGSFRYNQDLSQKRGEYVRDLLVSNGIDANIIAIVALGENNLPVATGDGVKELRNRRAEVDFRF